MNIEFYRNEIDRIDRELVRLFCARMEAAENIGRIKKQNGLPVENAARESAVLDTAAGCAPDRYKQSVAELYKAIFAISKSYQSEMPEDAEHE